MATAGCACAVAGSSTVSTSPSSSPMKQLQAHHPLACKTPPCMPLFRSSKLGSLVFFFYFPTRLNPISSPNHRLPPPPPLCSHGELEIVSVKELPDGFLHLSFGAPQSASKGDELSSSSGEHIAGKVAVPHRLPSKFSKKSPITLAAARQRRRQGESSSSKEGPVEAMPSVVKEGVKPSSRPKSSFVKRPPISKKNDSSLGTRLVLNAATNNDKSTSMTPAGMMPAGSIKDPMRPRSVFVKKSPIPCSVAKSNGKPPVLSEKAKALCSKVGDSTLAAKDVSDATKASRPRSVFSRRSPFVKVQHLSPMVSGTTGQSSPTEMSCSSSKVDEDSTPEASSKSREMSELSLHPMTVDLGKCKLPELRNLAKSRGVRGYSKLKKGELLDLLKNLDS